MSKKQPKTKAELMRKMRKQRAEQGLKQKTYWLTAEQHKKVEAILSER